MRALIVAVALAVVPYAPPAPVPITPPSHFHNLVHTYSIVAVDPTNGDLGVAVQSKFPNVGGIVPWARAGVGAVATQSLSNTTFEGMTGRFPVDVRNAVYGMGRE